MFNRAYIEITNLCNFHCDFCPGTTRPPMAMRLSDFRTAAEKLRPLTDYLYLHVMGEPLLHPDLDKVLAICRELGFKTCITTNGLLLPKKLDILRDAPALHKLSISLHSYESNRPDVPLETYLRGCVDACDVMGQRGTVCTLRLWNKGAEPQLNGEIERILGELARVDTRLLPRDGVGNRRLMYRTYIEEAQRFRWPGDPEYTGSDAEYCYGLRKQIAVLCDGTVVPCCLDGQGRLKLGNIFFQRMDEILGSHRAVCIRQGFDRRQPYEELCRRCGYAARFN